MIKEDANLYKVGVETTKETVTKYFRATLHRQWSAKELNEQMISRETTR